MENFISIKRIADNITEHPLLRDIPFDRIVNYVMELIRICGMPNMYIDKTDHVEIHEYRGELPCDLLELTAVRGMHGEEYVYSVSHFHTSPLKENHSTGTYSYTVQGNIIFSSEKERDIEIAYRTIPFDENGFPMIPDNAEFIRAIEAYIKFKRFTILFDLNQVSAAVLNNAMQNYSFCIAQAQTGFIRPSEDEMQSIANMWCKLVPDVTAHKTQFATAHNREILRNH